MKVNRVEKHIIKKSNPIYKVIDDRCFKSKNLYNYANYIIRQEFINNKKWIRANELDKTLQKHEAYTELGSQAAQKTLQLLDKNWKSFFKAIKDYSKNPSKYLGKPILFITPHQITSRTGANTVGLYLTDYVDAIKNRCAFYSVKYLDLYREGGIYPTLAAFKTAYIPDGCHLNAAGHKLLSVPIKHAILNLF
jgi:transposase